MKQLRPLAGPLAALLRSRKFLVAVLTITSSVVAVTRPELAERADTVAGTIVLVGGLLMTLIAGEDIARFITAWRTLDESTPVALPDPARNTEGL